MKLYAIAGRAGSGKSSAADWIVGRTLGVRLSFAAPIKHALVTMLADLGLQHWYFDDREFKEAPIDGIGVSPRRLAQTLGTEWGRDLIHPDLWVMHAAARARRAFEGFPAVVFDDLRFENEARWVRDNGGTVIHLIRDDAGSVLAHASESGVAVASGDEVVLNASGLEALYSALDAALGFAQVPA